MSTDLPLQSLQSAMHDFIVNGTLDPALEKLVEPGGHTARARLGIHANNFRLSLKGVLVSSFPLVETFVGEDFFDGLAGEFLKLRQPEKAVLAEFGADFPAFLADFEHVQDTPWLADVASLEWAIQTCGNAAEEQVASNGASPADIKLSDASTVVHSRWPLMMLWMAGMGQLQPEAIDLGAPGQNILVVRQDGAVKLHVLSDDDAGLYEALKRDIEGNWPVGDQDLPLAGSARHLFTLK